MSGHSKWHSIKHKKAKTDAARGQLFGRLIREITIAARAGGGNVDANSRLRTAVQAARDANMPGDNIERAIKKGTGELPGMQLEETIYEGYGPGGVAMMVEAVTDNRNRTASEVKKVFSKYGGHVGSAGCVAWMFQKRGLVTVEEGKADEDILTEVALETGADDLKKEGDTFALTIAPESLGTLKEALGRRGIEPTYAGVTMVPRNTVRVEGKTAEHVLKLAEALEGHEDVQNVYANFDVPDEVMAAFS